MTNKAPERLTDKVRESLSRLAISYVQTIGYPDGPAYRGAFIGAIESLLAAAVTQERERCHAIARSHVAMASRFAAKEKMRTAASIADEINAPPAATISKGPT